MWNDLERTEKVLIMAGVLINIIWALSIGVLAFYFFDFLEAVKASL